MNFRADKCKTNTHRITISKKYPTHHTNTWASHYTRHTEFTTRLPVQHWGIVQQCDTHTQTDINNLEKDIASARFITNNYIKTPGIATLSKQTTTMLRITNNEIDVNHHVYFHHANTQYL